MANFSTEIDAICSRLSNASIVGRTGRAFNDRAPMSTRNNIASLYRIGREGGWDRTLEVGLALGGSAVAMASVHRDLGRSPARQHVAIDPFQDESWDDTGVMNLEREGLDGYVDVIRQFSSVALAKLVEQKASFGLIYVDGSHLFEDAFVDFYFSIQLLVDGGIVLFDDSRDAHVRKVFKFIDSSFEGICEQVDLSNYRQDAGLKYQVARLMGKTQLTGYRKIGKWPRKWNSAFRRF